MAEGDVDTSLQPEKPIIVTAPKSQVDRYRMSIAYWDALERCSDSGSRNGDIMNLSLSIKPEEIKTYIDTHSQNLSPEENYLLNISLERALLYNRPEKAPEELVTLTGNEAKDFAVEQQRVDFFNGLSQLETNNDPMYGKILEITVAKDPMDIAQFIAVNKHNLSPLAEEVLNRSYLIKKGPVNT